MCVKEAKDTAQVYAAATEQADASSYKFPGDMMTTRVPFTAWRMELEKVLKYQSKKLKDSISDKMGNVVETPCTQF